MKRRGFLKGLGGAVATIPLLSHFGHLNAGAQTETGPRRIIVMPYAMGIARANWKPSATGYDFTLPYCTEPLTEFQDRCLFVSNLDQQLVQIPGGNATHGHNMKQEMSLTGSLTTDCFIGAQRNHVDDVRTSGDFEGNLAKNASICTAVGEAIRGSRPRRSVSFGLPGNARRSQDFFPSQFCWAAEASAETLTCNPTLAFEDLFAGIGDGTTGPDPTVVAANRRRQSVLDTVRDSFGTSSAGLDYRDRQRLSLHQDYIRQIELDLSAGPTCSQPTGVPTDPDWYVGRNMGERSDIFVRMMAQAMACDIAPVGRIEYFYQQNPRFGIPSVDAGLDQWGTDYDDDWHGLIHSATQSDGFRSRPDRGDLGTAGYHPSLLGGLRFYVQQFANLLRELDRFPEGPDGRTVLDNSLCVLASDLGDGHGHGPGKMGYILAGNLGPFATGYHFDAATGPGWSDDTTHNPQHVLTTIAQAFDLRDASGGEMSAYGIQGFSTGALPIPRV